MIIRCWANDLKIINDMILKDIVSLLANRINQPHVIECYLRKVYAKGYETGAEWQSKQSPWISVKERLPEKDGYYFVTDGDVIEKVYFFRRWNKFASTRDYPHLFYDEGVIKEWLLIPSFDKILEANRDVLERIKEKGD